MRLLILSLQIYLEQAVNFTTELLFLYIKKALSIVREGFNLYTHNN